MLLMSQVQLPLALALGNSSLAQTTSAGSPSPPRQYTLGVGVGCLWVPQGLGPARLALSSRPGNMAFPAPALAARLPAARTPMLTWKPETLWTVKD